MGRFGRLISERIWAGSKLPGLVSMGNRAAVEVVIIEVTEVLETRSNQKSDVPGGKERLKG